MRCIAKTKQGCQCKKTALKGSRFCYVHKDQFDLKKPIFTAMGLVVGHAVLPGLGGIVAGGVLGNLLGDFKYMKTKVFVSFDFDNDRVLKDFILGQSKLSDSPFEISDYSLKEAAPEHNWEEKALRAIKRSDIVLVIVGTHTFSAQGVLKEVNMARSLNKRIVQVVGYKGSNYKPVPGAGALYRWNWENLKKLLS